MKMAEVCSVFEETGMQNVTSVLASGNLLFSSDKSVSELKRILEKAMSEHFDYEAFLFIRSKDEIETYFTKNPFKANPDFHIYGFIGIDSFENVLQEEFEKSRKLENEAAKIVEGNFYWKTPKGGTLDSGFGKILGRKNMKDSFTSRNLNTFEKILKKMDF